MARSTAHEPEIAETLDAGGRRVLDVSALPDHAWDSRDPVWWGNTLLIFIETTTMVLLLVAYFYLRRNFTAWPPVQPNTEPPIYRPLPDLPVPTVELALIVLSCLPMYWTDMAARRNDGPKTVRGLWLMFAVAVVAVVLRFYEFPGLHFRWDENAYGSITWVILGMHLTYLLAQGPVEFFFIMALYLTRHPIDPKHGLDVTLAGGYWYWVAATWVAAYATVYIGAQSLMTITHANPPGPNPAAAAHGRSAALWAGVLGAPAVWAAQHEANYALAPWVCAHGGRGIFHVVTAVCLLLVAAAAYVAWRDFRAAGGGSPDSTDGGPVARRRFLGALGVVVSVMVFVVILAQGIAAFFFDPCWT